MLGFDSMNKLQSGACRFALCTAAKGIHPEGDIDKSALAYTKRFMCVLSILSQSPGNRTQSSGRPTLQCTVRDRKPKHPHER
jgi:hypothetical protein